MPRKTPRSAGAPSWPGPGFNEAAARCRGKPFARVMVTVRVVACFNEAAARCRGKPWACAADAVGAGGGFNEAAARCRGKPAGVAAGGANERGASMRPRPDAAENPQIAARPSTMVLELQ